MRQQQDKRRLLSRGGRLALLVLLAALPARADWPMGRGSAQRTGCLDDQPGPKTPAVLWAYKAQEDYVGSPLVEGGAIYFPALGPFNTGLFHCLATRDNQPRLLWSKQAPLLKRPLVCSPVAAEGLLFFGDGMHQTDDATLFCIMADSGRPVWQYQVPGKLVHLEASPVVSQGRVYSGGGDAGVFCLDSKRVLLDGKELDLETSQALVEERWKQLTAEANQAGKKGLPYASPNEDALPRPAPKLLWQKGQGIWHVDTPVTVVDDLVLAGSSFLDEEQIGKRALLCLRATDGTTVWEVPLDCNPWAGVTVAGHIALVGCSSIRFDTDQISKAAGEVVAVDLTTGRVAWRKKVPGGVLSTIAAKDGLAVFTATDGRVRAWSIATGEEKWQYDARHPFFAGPAIAGGVVYAADLAGQLHALQLTDGLVRWTFDMPNAPGTQMPGMVYGSPVVHRGRIYLTTCNVQGPNAGKPGMVVCVADKQAVARGVFGATLQLDKQARSVSLPCRIAPRKLPTLADIYPLEVIACFPSPIGQKAHETVLTTDVKPSDLHQALLQLGLQPGAPVHGDKAGRPTGAELSLALEITDITGQTFTIPLEDALQDTSTGRTMPPLKWYFTGSARREITAGSAPVYAADLSGTLISLFPVTAETVIQSSLEMKSRAGLRLDTDKWQLPPEEAEARLIITAGPARPTLSLAALLTQPSSFAAPPIRYQTSQVARVTELIPMPLRSDIPLPALRSAPCPPPAAYAKLRQAPVPDLAGLFMASPTPTPPLRSLSAGALARAPTPDLTLPPTLPSFARSKPDRAGVVGQSLADPAGSAAPDKAPALRQERVGFTRLAMPEPGLPIGALRPEAQLPDSDTPAPGTNLLRRVALPVRPK